MNRIIKFRAFDKYNQRFIYVTLHPTHIGWASPYFIAQGLLRGQDESVEGIGFAGIEGWQQNTGRKDKNGIEIYEGDIVTTCTFNYLKADHTVDRQASIDHSLKMGVVEWVQYNCSFMVMQRQYKDRLTDQWNNSFEMKPSDESYEVEVIGNIYEHPHLLNPTTEGTK